MRDIVLAVPGDLSIRTGGYVYDAHVLAELAGRRRTATALSLPRSFPYPSAVDMDEAFRRLEAVSDDSALIVDGLVFGVLPAARILMLGRSIVALVHHPLALETGLAANVAERLEASERDALGVADMVIATSRTTAETLIARFGVERHRLSVAEPGFDEAPRAVGNGDGAAVVLTVATVTPRKNHPTLAAALGRIKHLDWRWRIVGSRDRDPAAARELDAAVAAHGLEERVVYLGEIGATELAREYAGADLFALASRFEGYGMAYAEALARGLPVIAGAGGATAKTVPAEAGAVLDPDDVDAWTNALSRLLGDRDVRRAASNASWAYGRSLPRWSDAADAFERVAARLP